MTPELHIDTRPLGRSPLRVPRIALGCGSFGGIGSAPEFFGSGLDESQAFALMDAAWELGITHFDTADAYGGGASETMVGRWMRARGQRPLITTKTCNPMHAGADRGLAPARVRRQLQSSMQRLGVEQIDLYLAHDFDPDVAPASVLDTFAGLLEQGLIRAAGVSNYDTGKLRALLAAGRVDALQNSHSLLEPSDENELIPLCASERVGYAAYSPLAGGWLTGKYRHGEPFPAGSRMTQRPDGYAAFVDESVFDGLERLAAYAADGGISMAALALSWLLGDPDVTQIVLGPMRVEHLDPLREALAHPLDPARRAQIAALVAR